MKSRNKYLFIIILLIVVVGAGLAFFAGRTPSEDATTVKQTLKKDSATVVVNRKFGLATDSFTVVEETVKPNEFLSNILDKYHIAYATIARLAAKSKTIFNVRDIAAGHPYTVFCSKDSAQKAEYFVYQPNPIDYIVYDLRDSVNIYTGKRKVTTKMKTASGVINSSLYETIEKAGADASLAARLADMYAWTIDFYSIRQGDWFKVMYEQQYVAGEPVETGHIQSAVFYHDGEKFYSFYFRPDSTKDGDYYDEQGKSLRKAFLKAPLKFSHITSRYTLHRFHPIEKRWKAHLGTDYGAPTGTPILATGSGVVIASQFKRFNGNYVKIKHNATYTTQYLHMSRRAVKPGQHVRQGQVIGYVGMTGEATGPHVCYRFWKNGRQVDPLKQHFPAANPVKADERPAFDQVKKEQEQQLAGLSIDSVQAD